MLAYRRRLELSLGCFFSRSQTIGRPHGRRRAAYAFWYRSDGARWGEACIGGFNWLQRSSARTIRNGDLRVARDAFACGDQMGRLDGIDCDRKNGWSTLVRPRSCGRIGRSLRFQRFSMKSRAVHLFQWLLGGPLNRVEPTVERSFRDRVLSQVESVLPWSTHQVSAISQGLESSMVVPK